MANWINNHYVIIIIKKKWKKIEKSILEKESS